MNVGRRIIEDEISTNAAVKNGGLIVKYTFRAEKIVETSLESLVWKFQVLEGQWAADSYRPICLAAEARLSQRQLSSGSSMAEVAELQGFILVLAVQKAK